MSDNTSNPAHYPADNDELTATQESGGFKVRLDRKCMVKGCTSPEGGFLEANLRSGVTWELPFVACTTHTDKLAELGEAMIAIAVVDADTISTIMEMKEALS